MNPNQKISASTQQFTEIVDFQEDIVVFRGGNAALVVEITASNFALLSQKEQLSRIYAYAALLNSLTFPVQILIRNKRIDVSSYLKELDLVIQSTKNAQLNIYMRNYRDFVRELVTVNVVLNKSFYFVISFSSLETGIAGAGQVFKVNPNQQLDYQTFIQTARRNLEAKADVLLPQLQKFAVSAKILKKEDLIKLFYEVYNESVGSIEVEQTLPEVNAPFVTGKVPA